jgi:ferredoxin
MHITSDQARCVGSGQCAMLSPDVFDQGDDGIVVVLQDRPGEELRDEVLQAIDLCPSRSIALAE